VGVNKKLVAPFAGEDNSNVPGPASHPAILAHSNTLIATKTNDLTLNRVMILGKDYHHRRHSLPSPQLKPL
jgi:hypothetical protein